MHPGAVRDARARAAHASAGPLAPPARARVRCACIDRWRQIEPRFRPQPRPLLQRSYRPPGRASTPAFPGLGQGACALAEARYHPAQGTRSRGHAPPSTQRDRALLSRLREKNLRKQAQHQAHRPPRGGGGGEKKEPRRRGEKWA